GAGERHRAGGDDLDLQRQARRRRGRRRTGPVRLEAPSLGRLSGLSSRRGPSPLSPLERRGSTAPPRYQPRVSSSSFGSSEAVEMPTIGSPSPSETRASTPASM